MTESAYQEPPWLIDRQDVGYLQVSRLLYQIAEHCDGRRTPSEIAEAITEEGEPVKAETIERNLAGLLIPSGVVVGADGNVATPAARPRSPLSLAGRMKMLGPGAIEPLTGTLRLLFLPPVVAVVLLATVAARFWLYGFHGVAGPAHDALYHPVDLLVLFVLMVLSAGFHEFGHAAALRYGGGRVRGMGVGLYMVYPAVYTDVTDNYRLPRWARVRTDLGGFHFNLIFSLGVLAVALLTGWQYLLVFLLLTDLEILQQSLPFVRFDGYWALADITGISDFFTHMGLFWRRQLHLPMPPGQQSPRLKRWGTIVLAVYSVITVPILVIFLLLTIAALPRVLATAWDSGGHQLAAASHAAAQHELLGIGLAAFQILILAFPAAAALYMLGRVFKQFQVRIWGWAEGSNGRRAVAALSTLAVVLVCGLLWAPALPHGGRGPAYANLTPIRPAERGTIVDLAASGVAAATRPIGVPVAVIPAPQATAAAAGQASPAPDASPTASPTASPAAEPSPSPSP